MWFWIFKFWHFLFCFFVFVSKLIFIDFHLIYKKLGILFIDLLNWSSNVLKLSSFQNRRLWFLVNLNLKIMKSSRKLVKAPLALFIKSDIAPLMSCMQWSAIKNLTPRRNFKIRLQPSIKYTKYSISLVKTLKKPNYPLIFVWDHIFRSLLQTRCSCPYMERTLWICSRNVTAALTRIQFMKFQRQC